MYYDPAYQPLRSTGYVVPNYGMHYYNPYRYRYYSPNRYYYDGLRRYYYVPSGRVIRYWRR